MIQQGFHVGANKWYVMCVYDIRNEDDLTEVEGILLASGCDNSQINVVLQTLQKPNTGFTFTSFSEHFSVIIISHATSAEQMYDTIQHELKHVVEHISEYYDVCPRSEEAAYLQGEIARNIFPAAAFLVCPNCH